MWLIWLVGFFFLILNSFKVFFLVKNKLGFFESNPHRKSRHPSYPILPIRVSLFRHTHLLARAPAQGVCLPAQLPPRPGSSVTSSSLAPNLHLPVLTKPEALPKRFWSDSSTKQEAPHFQFMALFTGYITQPQKSLSAS